jgi:hypothetical protein
MRQREGGLPQEQALYCNQTRGHFSVIGIWICPALRGRLVMLHHGILDASVLRIGLGGHDL